MLHAYVNQGGFGTVYKARDLQQPGVECAVKVVPFESQEQYDQALQEVDILQRHKLPFMPYFYTMQLHGDSVYIVTEYISGTTLNTYQRGFWHPSRVERMVKILLGHLKELHKRAIVHRDLSPTNVMRVGNDPADYVLLDFGIAKEGSSTFSAAHRAGNPGYVAPEQLRGEKSSATSDLYSLGATAYALLTGSMPTTLDRLAGARLARPSELVPNVSPVLDQLLIWLLQLDPARRPQSAAAALAWIERQKRPAPRRLAPTVRGPGWAALLALGLAGLWLLTRLPSPLPPGQPVALQGVMVSDGADPGRVVFTSARTGTYELYVTDGPGAQPTPLAQRAAAEFAPGWSPDGSQVVFVQEQDDNYDIYRVSLDGRVYEPVAVSPGTEATPAWAPDGQRVAFSSNNSGDFELYTVEIRSVVGWRQLTSRPGIDRSPVWVDDRTLVFISQRGQAWGLYRLALDSGAETPIYEGSQELFTPALSPDGARLAFAMRGQDDNVDLYVIDAGGGAPRRLTSDPGEDSYPSWSPDGSQIIFQSKRDDPSGAGRAQLYLVGQDGGGESRVSRDSPDDRQPAWRGGGP